MSNQIIKFKENANPAKFNLGLERQGRSKFPGCVDIIQAGIGRDGRWKTGIDEKSISVMGITDSVLRQETITKLEKERKDLEELTGFDLSGLSKFWDTFFVEINTSQTLDLSNPLDRVKYHVILANNGAAPSLKACTESDYYHTKYYVAREHEDVSERLEKKKKLIAAGTALDKLAKTPDKLIQVLRYLDQHVSNNTPPDNLYDIATLYLDGDEKTGSIDKFLAATKKSPEEINIKLIFADALKLGVIRQRDGLFQRGNITMGRDPKDVITFLSDVKNSGELLSIQEEIEQKRKFG